MLTPSGKVKLSVQQVNHSLTQSKSTELNLKDTMSITTTVSGDNSSIIKRYIGSFGGLAIGALIFGIIIGVIVFTVMLVIKLLSKILLIMRCFSNLFGRYHKK
jgi:hypothetical protein